MDEAPEVDGNDGAYIWFTMGMPEVVGIDGANIWLMMGHCIFLQNISSFTHRKNNATNLNTIGYWLMV